MRNIKSFNEMFDSEDIKLKYSKILHPSQNKWTNYKSADEIVIKNKMGFIFDTIRNQKAFEGMNFSRIVSGSSEIIIIDKFGIYLEKFGTGVIINIYDGNFIIKSQCSTKEKFLYNNEVNIKYKSITDLIEKIDTHLPKIRKDFENWFNENFKKDFNEIKF